MFCDVSSYTNFNEDELNDGGGKFKEPTLLKRYKYIIRPASECANALKEGPLEKYEIDYPAESKSSINLTMLSLPGNYFWYESGNSGNMISAEGFEYRIGNDGSYVPFSKKKPKSPAVFQNNPAKCWLYEKYSPTLHPEISENPDELLWPISDHVAKPD